jgi:hypothetical protein
MSSNCASSNRLTQGSALRHKPFVKIGKGQQFAYFRRIAKPFLRIDVQIVQRVLPHFFEQAGTGVLLG